MLNPHNTSLNLLFDDTAFNIEYLYGVIWACYEGWMLRLK